MTANHRLSGGLAFGTAYTLAKTMSMINALTVYLDPRERLYAYDDNDRRHILSFQGSWNLPNGSALWNSAVGRGLLDGWQLAGVGFWRSGTPSTVTYTTTDAGGTDTIGGGDPVRVSMVAGCDPILSRGRTQRGPMVRYRLFRPHAGRQLWGLAGEQRASARQHEPGPVDVEDASPSGADTGSSSGPTPTTPSASARRR